MGLNSLLIVVAYVVLGKAALMLALPPGYASAIFPPAGIAVAAAFILGRRALLPVLAGSLLLNLWVGYSNSHHLSASGFYAALCIAVASALQAGAGGVILRRAVGYPAAFDNVRDIGRFILLSPLICTVSATLSVASLVELGVFDAGHSVASWFAWWIGDTLGVLIMLPLAMVAAGEPRRLWRGRVSTLAIPTVMALAVFIGIFIKANHWEQEQALGDFRQVSQQSLDQIRMGLEEQAGVLAQLEGLMLHDVQGRVTRQEFHRYCEETLAGFSMIQALEWAPFVDDAGRMSFERAQRAEVPGFAITERAADGKMKAAEKRSWYAPVTYVEPLAGNESALGFDLVSRENRRAALEKAVSTGGAVATEPVRLVQANGQTGVLIVKSVRLNGVDAGVVLSVVKVNSFVEKVLPPAASEFFVRLVDMGTQRPIYDTFPEDGTEAIFEREFDFGGGRYRIETAPTAAYYLHHHGWQSWGVLAMGSLATTLLSALLLLGTGYTRRVEIMVEEKTRELSENEEKLRGLYEHSTLGIALTDMSGRYLEFNQAFESICGYPKEELNKLDYWALTPKKYADDEARQLESLRTTGHYGPYEKEYIRKDGSLIPVRLNGQLLTGRDGRQYIWSVVEDIAERRHAEEVVMLQHENLLHILEASPIAVRVAGGGGIRVMFANTRYAELINIGREDLLGVDPRPFYAHRQDYEEVLAEIRQGRTVMNRTVELSIPGKGTVWTLASYMPIDYLGERAVLGWFFDVTELHDAREAALLAAKVRTEFLANMSHEIRTPMNGIIGLTQLALNRQASPAVHDYLEKIAASSQGLLGILNDILDFSKLEAGGVRIEHAPFDLDSLLDNLRSMFMDRAVSKGLGFNIVVAEGTPRVLQGDVLRLQQVLSNLLGNAVKFTGQGEVALHVGQIAHTENETELEFSVTDTGIGMNREDLEKLFQPFSQADGSIARRFGGTGLGLAISEGMLNLMGSHCMVESRPDKGSTFLFRLRFTVPDAADAREFRQRAHHEPGSLSRHLAERGYQLFGARILVAEDNPINQQVVGEFLRLSGISVTFANNGQQVLEALAQNTFDGILMDIHMPGMGGIEATGLIRAGNVQNRIPIIALTADIMPEERAMCLKAGMSDFVSKPIDPDTLIGALVRHVTVPPEAAKARPPRDAAVAREGGGQLMNLPGFDLQPILDMLPGEESVVRELLQLFRDEAKSAPPRIQAALDAGDVPAATALVHKLKGTSGNIGATQVYEKAKTLEVVLKAGRQDAALWDELAAALDRAAQAVDAAGL